MSITVRYTAAGIVYDKRLPILSSSLSFRPGGREFRFFENMYRSAYCVVRYYICFWFSNNSHLYVFPFCLFFQVKNEGRALFLNAVCMKCLDGKDADRKLCCRFCAVQWDGSSLIMGTMYAYDVFAAMPCCNERLKVCTVFN